MTAMSDAADARLARPMDLGAILDGAFSLYRRNFVVLVGAFGILLVPIALLAIAIGGAAIFLLPPVATLVTPAIGALAVADVAVGIRPTIGGIWSRMARILPALLLTELITLFAVGLGTLLLVIPGILFYVWFSLSAQAVAMENFRYFSALGRSRRLVKGSWWRVFGILIVIGLVVGIASNLVETFVLALLGALGIGSGVSVLAPSSGTAHLASISRLLAATISTVLVGPVSALASALLYFDLRLRKEGTDIAAAVDALE